MLLDARFFYFSSQQKGSKGSKSNIHPSKNPKQQIRIPYLTCSHQMWSCLLVAACWMQDESEDGEQVKKKAEKKELFIGPVRSKVHQHLLYYWWHTDPPNHKPQLWPQTNWIFMFKVSVIWNSSISLMSAYEYSWPKHGSQARLDRSSRQQRLRRQRLLSGKWTETSQRVTWQLWE